MIMEVDTGAALSLISETAFKELWPDRSISATTVTLCSYSGETIPVLGSVDTEVRYKGQRACLTLLVVRGTGPSLVGRNWLECLKIHWSDVNCVNEGVLYKILQRFDSVFQDRSGTFQGPKATISIEPGAQPRFSKARSVPYALCEKVDIELKRLVDEGTLEPVQLPEWASPIVAVLKSDRKTVQICGDFKKNINPVSKLDRYPIPKVEGLFARLAGGRSFTKLDLSQAYQQIPLDDQSKKFAVINTQRVISLYQASLWYLLCTRYFSEGNGPPSKGYPRSHGILGRYTGYRSYD